MYLSGDTATAPIKSTQRTLLELHAAREDFEWYPTTPEILGKVAASIRYKTDRYHRDALKILDIGAGDGRALVRLQAMLADEKDSWETVSLTPLAIEKSLTHLRNLPKDITVIGADFHEQTLVDKEVDIVFCNPPYSEYEAWAYRILRECAAEYVYLVIPQRWRESRRLADVVEDLGLTAHSLGEFDFERAERQARARVEIVRFDMGERKGTAAFDRAIEDMLPELDRFECEIDEEEAKTAKRWDNQLADGGSLVDSLVAAYDADLAELYGTYRSVVTINPKILKELGVTKGCILAGLREKIKGLKNKYWQVLFEHLDDVKKRFATKQRRLFLDSLADKTVIDFTHGNVRAMLIWIAKWAGDYCDEQLIELFQSLAKKCNVQNYKSNQRVWLKDDWRYRADEQKNSHYKLDYRLVVGMYTAIVEPSRSWDAQNGLSKSCHDFLADLVTVANNLGFACHDSSRTRHWASGVKHELHLANGEPLLDVKAFQNGNLHIRVNKRVMLAINVQAGKLLGWIHSAAEAVQELQPDAEDAAYVAEVFNLSHRIEPAKLLRLACAS